jgi:hypothetical protein
MSPPYTSGDSMYTRQFASKILSSELEWASSAIYEMRPQSARLRCPVD